MHVYTQSGRKQFLVCTTVCFYCCLHTLCLEFYVSCSVYLQGHILQCLSYSLLKFSLTNGMGVEGQTFNLSLSFAQEKKRQMGELRWFIDTKIVDTLASSLVARAQQLFSRSAGMCLRGWGFRFNLRVHCCFSIKCPWCNCTAVPQQKCWCVSWVK